MGSAHRLPALPVGHRPQILALIDAEKGEIQATLTPEQVARLAAYMPGRRCGCRECAAAEEERADRAEQELICLRAELEQLRRG